MKTLAEQVQEYMSWRIQSQSVADELQKLSALHRDGVITDEQLERQKAALLK